ncbi:hypothetical protein CJD36_008820 [Flavipsychrobacter stenotrophus]|uniref:Lipocalin-like domain-containing protein n=1 Tax=Flavipsychrobacter stenotrophus TaxID=2077091 RepID=A0A2S7SZ46_9BACT|nr:hypothetical protein [Flavipsychrobacter stenotrophus]PQJ11887.1 hypothetical protein CJD36_008820 [Flavipsychrobacter stenotrophus]
MKYFLIPAALLATFLLSNNATAQTKGKGKTPAVAPTAAQAAAVAEAPAGPINMKDIEGKWKVDHIDIDSKPADGEASKSTEPGADDDFYDFAKGTLNSYLTGASLSVPYSFSGHSVVYKQDGISDTLHVTSLSKTKATIIKKDIGDDGTTITTITLKK